MDLVTAGIATDGFYQNVSEFKPFGRLLWKSIAWAGRPAYLIRVQVTVLQSTAATQPDRSTASLLLTVMVPE